MNVSPKVRIAIIGAGYMAEEHIKAFQDIENVEISGIHSRTKESAVVLAEKYNINVVCDSVEALFQTLEPSMVVVTVPELAAYGVIRRCLEFPWKILVEKPAGHSFEEAGQLVADSSNRCGDIFVALNRRFHSATQALKQQLLEDPSPRFIHIIDQQDQASALAAGQPKEVIDRWMYANSIHLIDYLSVLCRGSVTEIKPISPWNPEMPGVVLSHVTFSSGDTGLYEGIWHGPGPWSVTVTVPSARFELRPLERLSVQRKGERTNVAVETDVWDIDFKPGLRLQADHAIKAARGEPHYIPTIQEAFSTMTLIHEIFGL